MQDSVRIFFALNIYSPSLFFPLMSAHPENNERTTEPEPLKEGRDYYLENGYWVFTEHYLLLRGQCCGSGCRHCPYRKKRKSGLLSRPLFDPDH